MNKLLCLGVPIKLEEDPKGDKKIEKILESSSESWVSTSLALQPDYGNYGDFGFEVPDEMKKSAGVSIEEALRVISKIDLTPLKMMLQKRSERFNGRRSG